MTLLKLAHLGHPAIRAGTHPVPDEAVGEPALQVLIDDMIETMRDAGGVGIAAPQVHDPRRIAVIEVTAGHPRVAEQGPIPLTVLVNPVIVARSGDTNEGWEGCLSIPDLRGRVPRHSAVEVRALGRDGHPLHFTASGLFARIVQHEVDHLDGHVYLDRMQDLSSLCCLQEYQRFHAPR